VQGNSKALQGYFVAFSSLAGSRMIRLTFKNVLMLEAEMVMLLTASMPVSSVCPLFLLFKKERQLLEKHQYIITTLN